MPSLRNSVIDSAGNVASAHRLASVEQKSDFIQGKFLALGSPCEVLLDSKDETLARRLIEVASTEAWRIEKSAGQVDEDLPPPPSDNETPPLPDDDDLPF